MARLPDWGQSEAKPPADVEIGTSLSRYPDFPLLLSHSYHVPLPILSFLLYATDTRLRRLISDYTGFDQYLLFPFKHSPSSLLPFIPFRYSSIY